jgi:hypothetical protein
VDSLGRAWVADAGRHRVDAYETFASALAAKLAAHPEAGRADVFDQAAALAESFPEVVPWLAASPERALPFMTAVRDRLAALDPYRRAIVLDPDSTLEAKLRVLGMPTADENAVLAAVDAIAKPAAAAVAAPSGLSELRREIMAKSGIGDANALVRRLALRLGDSEILAVAAAKWLRQLADRGDPDAARAVQGWTGPQRSSPMKK